MKSEFDRGRILHLVVINAFVGGMVGMVLTGVFAAGVGMTSGDWATFGKHLVALVAVAVGAFGLSFQLPVATWFAARAGLLDHKDMIGGFRYAVVGIFVIAAILTPPDVLTQSLLAAPLIVLYALSIGIAWASTTKQRIEDLTEGS